MMLGGAYEALILATRYHQKLNDATQIQQETMTLLGKLERSVSAASGDSLEVSPDNTAIRFASARTSDEFFDLDPSGSPRWHSWVCYYLEGTTLICKDKILPAPFTATPPATGFSYPTIDDIKLDNTARRTELSTQVGKILFEDGASTVSIVLETQSKAKFANGLTVLVRVHLAQ